MYSSVNFLKEKHLCNQYPDLKTVISRTPECPLLLTPHKGNHYPGLTPCSSFTGFKIWSKWNLIGCTFLILVSFTSHHVWDSSLWLHSAVAHSLSLQHSVPYINMPPFIYFLLIDIRVVSRVWPLYKQSAVLSLFLHKYQNPWLLLSPPTPSLNPRTSTFGQDEETGTGFTLISETFFNVIQNVGNDGF